MRRARGGFAVEHPGEARVVPSVRRGIASEEHRRANRRPDQGEEELGADGLLVVDRGRRSGEDVATRAAEERAVACGAADYTLAVTGELV
ncbi:MAG: hypothetical protein AABM32_03245 [Chloroflexota bacterium]